MRRPSSANPKVNSRAGTPELSIYLNMCLRTKYD